MARDITVRSLELELEANINITSVWGTGDVSPKSVGFDAVRVKVHLDADAPQAELDELIKQATTWSRVANTFTKPVALDVSGRNRTRSFASRHTLRLTLATPEQELVGGFTTRWNVASMKLGLSMRYLGYHAAAWRLPEVDAAGASTFRHFVGVAQKAEAAKFDMVFLADGIGIRAKDEPEGSLCRSAQTAELEPLTLLSALSAVTHHIGLVATASTTYNEPFHIARKYASLDRISDGRAGWNIVTSWSDAEARNFNREQHLEYDTRYERAAEFVEVVKGLWDSWEEDALVRDKATGIFFDPAKLHPLDHVGKHFRVRGPLSVARTQQGRPLLVQAGASEQGLEIAAASADVVYSASQDLTSAQDYYRDLKSRLAKHGREASDLLVMPGFTPFVGRTLQEAQDKYDRLNELVDPRLGLSYLYGQLGDLSGHDLDGPVPEPVDPKVRSIAKGLVAMAHRESLTIRQLYTRIAAGFGSRVVIGTPESIADDMQHWMETGAADGFNICPAALPIGLEEFAGLVIPELQRRGLFRTEYQGRTLRENLGLRPLVNRYAAARTSTGAVADRICGSETG